MAKKICIVDQSSCVSCGACLKVCPTKALAIYKGIFCQVDVAKCIGCGKCAKECPASVISLGLLDGGDL